MLGGVWGGAGTGGGKKFVRTSKLLLFFSAVPWIAVKLIRKGNWQKKNTDVKFDAFRGFFVRGRVFFVRVLLLNHDCLGSVQCLYSRRLQEGSRVKQWSVFWWWWWWWHVTVLEEKGVGLGRGGKGGEGWRGEEGGWVGGGVLWELEASVWRFKGLHGI